MGKSITVFITSCLLLSFGVLVGQTSQTSQPGQPDITLVEAGDKDKILFFSSISADEKWISAVGFDTSVRPQKQSGYLYDVAKGKLARLAMAKYKNDADIIYEIVMPYEKSLTDVAVVVASKVERTQQGPKTTSCAYLVNLQNQTILAAFGQVQHPIWVGKDIWFNKEEDGEQSVYVYNTEKSATVKKDFCIELAAAVGNNHIMGHRPPNDDEQQNKVTDAYPVMTLNGKVIYTHFGRKDAKLITGDKYFAFRDKPGNQNSPDSLDINKLDSQNCPVAAGKIFISPGPGNGAFFGKNANLYIYDQIGKELWMCIPEKSISKFKKKVDAFIGGPTNFYYIEAKTQKICETAQTGDDWEEKPFATDAEINIAGEINISPLDGGNEPFRVELPPPTSQPTADKAGPDKK